MSGLTAIDLPNLPAPGVVETLDYETIRAELIALMQTLQPDWDASVESDPAVKIIEICAVYIVNNRQRVNDAARGVMLAYATGTDLDHLAALFGVSRQLITPADLEASPPVEAVYEADDRLRQRVQLSLEGFTTAGPVGAYVFHALSASPFVKDVDVSSPAPGIVQVAILSTEVDGAPDQPLLDTVTIALSADDVRPLCDTVTVIAPTIVDYTIDASLSFYDGPDKEVVRLAAEAAAQKYADDHHRLGHDITISGLHAALHQVGVQNVSLVSPAADIAISGTEAARLTSISVTAGGTDE